MSVLSHVFVLFVALFCCPLPPPPTPSQLLPRPLLFRAGVSSWAQFLGISPLPPCLLPSLALRRTLLCKLWRLVVPISVSACVCVCACACHFTERSLATTRAPYGVNTTGRTRRCFACASLSVFFRGVKATATRVCGSGVLLPSGPTLGRLMGC